MKKDAVFSVIGTFLRKSVLPLCLVALVWFLAAPLSRSFGEWSMFVFLVLMGMPYGIKQIRVWLVPRNHSTEATLIIHIVQFLLACLIGVPILAWRVVCAAFYMIKTIVDLIRIAATPAGQYMPNIE